MRWTRLNADGCDWEVRAIASDMDTDPAHATNREILEFSPVDMNRPPRRIEVDAGVLSTVSETELRALYQQSRPIGGDYYGRPGKRMPDAKE
jgi:hypothetical protein